MSEFTGRNLPYNKGPSMEHEFKAFMLEKGLWDRFERDFTPAHVYGKAMDMEYFFERTPPKHYVNFGLIWAPHNEWEEVHEQWQSYVRMHEILLGKTE